MQLVRAIRFDERGMELSPRGLGGGPEIEDERREVGVESTEIRVSPATRDGRERTNRKAMNHSNTAETLWILSQRDEGSIPLGSDRQVALHAQLNQFGSSREGGGAH